MELNLNNSNGPLSICIVDDDTDVIYYLKRALKGNVNIHCYSWSTPKGYHGLRNFILKCPVDLFILDINLPGISGFKLGERLRHEYGQETPIIYISQDVGIKEYFDQDHRNTYFISKPIDKDEINRAVEYMSIFSGNNTVTL